MAKVEVYSSPFCPFCFRAKKLLDEKGVQYEEIDVIANPRRRPEMEERSGRHTVPQIFVGERHVGGCDDLYALDKAGKLDPLLAGA